MKIGIITLPFNSNYGGILQAYALQKTLKNLGHEAININRFSKGIGISLKMKILSFGNRFIKRYIFGRKIPVRTWPNTKEQQYISQHTNQFITNNLSLTHQLKKESDFATLKEYNFDAYIVGSDQVWRPKYSPNIENHYLGFLTEKKTKRIAYAASFGVDYWEYTPEQTQKCKTLATKFNAISVREESAVKLCNEFLNVKALQLPDPTMLLNKNEYTSLVINDNLPERKENLLIYVLDESPKTKNIIKKIEEKLALKSFSTMPENLFRFVGKEKINTCVAPSVTNWIKGFIDAEFVITDSFHGTVFSIIFNKPFITLGNTKRGMSRFTSLLKTFNLENRLLDEESHNLEEILNSKIDFEKVNQALNQKRQEALIFLNNALSN